MQPDILCHTGPPLTNDELNALTAISWPDHQGRDFRSLLSHSLAHICAFDGATPIGHVNLAWDDGGGGSAQNSAGARR